jgi:glycosyltransferase involved in cell wall biosynthesis
MLTAGLPQPTGSGGAIRNWYILRYLTEELGATVQVLAFDAGIGTPIAEPLPDGVTATVLPTPMRAWQQRVGTLTSSTRPDLADRLWSAEARTRIFLATQRGRVDVVHVGGLEVARYALEMANETRRDRPTIVLDEFNAEWLVQRRAAATDWAALPHWPRAAYSAVQWRRLRGFERAACLMADHIVAVSAADAAALATLHPALQPTIIPNGTDVRRYAPVDRATPGLPRFNLLFSGTMDYRPNVDAAEWLVRSVWPRLLRRRPALTLGLVGQRPTAAVRVLGTRPGVTVTGPVPDDRPYLWGSDIFAVPMRYGGGVRLKVLNALAAGCGLVSTSMGIEGIDVEPGRDILLADSTAQWEQQVDRLLSDPALRARLSAAGQAAAMRYDWRALVRRFGPVYEQALTQPGRQGHPSATLR